MKLNLFIMVYFVLSITGQVKITKVPGFFSTNQKGEFTNTFLADFYDTESLLAKLDKIKIKEKSLKEIIDNKLYDPSSLTIF